MDCPKDETHEDPIGVASAPLSILHEAQTAPRQTRGILVVNHDWLSCCYGGTGAPDKQCK